jgi:hypothetical protein
MEFELLHQQLIQNEGIPIASASAFFHVEDPNLQWIADTFNSLPPVDDWYLGIECEQHPLSVYFEDLM